MNGCPEGRTKDSSLVSLVIRGGPLPTGSVRVTGGRESDVWVWGGVGVMYDAGTWCEGVKVACRRRVSVVNVSVSLVGPRRQRQELH